MIYFFMVKHLKHNNLIFLSMFLAGQGYFEETLKDFALISQCVSHIWSFIRYCHLFGNDKPGKYCLMNLFNLEEKPKLG